MGAELFQWGEMDMNDPLDLKIRTIEGIDAQENARFYPSQKTFDQSNKISMMLA